MATKTGVGAHSVTSMAVELYLRVEKANMKPKNNIKAKQNLQKSSRPDSPKKAKKVPKCQTKNLKVKSDQKCKI